MRKNKYIFSGGLIDLAHPRLGSKIVFKTDEFFAPAKRIINPAPPVFKEDVFDKHGKWMDGWETRRKRIKGHDYLILKFGKPGKISKVDIDTSYFSGNHPTKISLEACLNKSKMPKKNCKWVKILNKKTTKANKHHFFKIKNKSIFSHIKLNIYPDGGVARLRVYGSLVIKKNFDPRSYRISSKKLLKIGFEPRYTVNDAIMEMKNRFQKKILKDNPRFHSIKWLKKIYDKKKI